MKQMNQPSYFNIFLILGCQISHKLSKWNNWKRFKYYYKSFNIKLAVKNKKFTLQVLSSLPLCSELKWKIFEIQIDDNKRYWQRERRLITPGLLGGETCRPVDHVEDEEQDGEHHQAHVVHCRSGRVRECKARS